MKHELKTWIGYYQEIASGNKDFEVRRNDRDYQTGDILILKEWDNEKGYYTGNVTAKSVSYILYGPAFGVEDGYCVMSLKPTEL